MTEKKNTVTVVGQSVIHTYPASTLSAKYGLPVNVVRKLKFGGEVEIGPATAMAMKADGVVGIIEKKKSKEK